MATKTDSDRRYEDDLAYLSSMEEDARAARRIVKHCKLCRATGFRPSRSRLTGEHAYPTVVRCGCMRGWVEACHTYSTKLDELDRRIDPAKEWLFEQPSPPTEHPATSEQMARAKQAIAKMAAGMWLEKDEWGVKDEV